MKKITSLLLLLAAKGSIGQSIERRLVGVNGSTLISKNYQLSYSIGETATGITPIIKVGSPFFATIGFQQPNVAKAGAVLHADQWVSAYPNPVISKVRLDVHSVYPQENMVAFTNLLGQQVSLPAFYFTNGSTEIDMSNLAKGVYIVSVTDKVTGNTVCTRIIKQ